MSRPSTAVASKKRMRKTADDLCRKLAHARGHCEAAGFDDVECSGRLEWSHIIGRGYMQVRWDDDNYTCCCHAHHFYFTNHDLAADRFHTGYLGAEHFAALRLRAEQQMGNFIDYDAIIERLRTRVAEVEAA